MRVYISFGMNEKLFPSNCVIEKQTVSHQFVKDVISNGDYVSLAIPQQKPIFDFLDFPVPINPVRPSVKLDSGDALIVVSCNDLPDYAYSEIQDLISFSPDVEFEYSLWRIK